MRALLRVERLPEADFRAGVAAWTDADLRLRAVFLVVVFLAAFRLLVDFLATLRLLVAFRAVLRAPFLAVFLAVFRFAFLATVDFLAEEDLRFADFFAVERFAVFLRFVVVLALFDLLALRRRSFGMVSSHLFILESLPTRSIGRSSEGL